MGQTASPAPVTSLTLTRWNDPDFFVAVSSGFNDLPNLPSFEQAKPFMSIVRNNHSLMAKAYTVVWSFESGGVAHTIHTQYIQKHRMSLGATKPILPSTSRLLSPSLNMSIVEFGVRKNNPGTLAPEEIPYPNPQVLGSYVDAVIFADSSMEGPDEFGTRDRWVGTRHAEHDAGVAVDRLLKQGLSAQAIGEQLASRVKVYQARVFANHRTAPRIAPMYWAARAQEAFHLQRVVEKQGLAASRRPANKESSTRRNPWPVLSRQR